MTMTHDKYLQAKGDPSVSRPYSNIALLLTYRTASRHPVGGAHTSCLSEGHRRALCEMRATAAYKAPNFHGPSPDIF